MTFKQRPTSFKIAAFLLPLSFVLYVSSLTMRVASVEGRVDLDAAGIQQALVADFEKNLPVKAITAEVSGMIFEVIKERFPVFANDNTFRMINESVTSQVTTRGPKILTSMMPQLDIPAPEPDIREVRLLQTIRDLWEIDDVFLATCITLFTVVFPISKYIALAWLTFGAAATTSRKRVLSWLKSWGQWSMGDVFVVAFMVVFLKINTSVVSSSTLAEIRVRVAVESGMYLFAASVMLAMICSMLLSASEPSDA
ncbi:MAG: hypothetical protein ACI8TX_000783 [Hyphomicrobiaceae bacterium]|jgi:hypothetical protein